MKLFNDKKDDEFTAELENHAIKDSNIYRLYFLDYYRIGYGYESKERNVGITDWPFEPFMLPENMMKEDAFKVLSYLTDYLEKNYNLEECSFQSVKLLNDFLNIPRFGFKKVNEDNDEKIINLYTVVGRIGLFKKSKYYSSYFEWYQENVSLDEVKEIYQKIGLDFTDVIISKPRILVKENTSQN